MDVVRLRPNYMKTASGGTFKTKQRIFGDHPPAREYDPDSSAYSNSSTLAPDYGSVGHGYVPPRKFNGEGPVSHGQHYIFGKSSDAAEVRNEKVISDSLSPTRVPTRESFKPSSLPLIPVITDEEDVPPKFGMKDADTQTKSFNMMKIYLPGIKEHRQWKAEKADPFLEVSQ